MITRIFIPVFLTTVIFFVLILQLMDLFSNLWRYFAHEVTFQQIASIAFLFVPKCVSYSIPIALLFSISYSLGMLYTNNELVAIFGCGISIYQLTFPFLAFGLILSVGSFFFEDHVVIPTFKEKKELYRLAVKQTLSYSNANVTVISGDHTVIYKADYYNDDKETLTGVLIVERSAEGTLLKRIDAQLGKWEGEYWVLHECRIVSSGSENGSTVFTEESVQTYHQTNLIESPSVFRKPIRNVDEMSFEDSHRWVNILKNAGFPDRYRNTLTDYYKKISMALTPLIVSILSSSLGGTFRKNILLMCLLSSLVLSVIYFVIQMIAVILAKSGYIPPFAGSWGVFFLYLLFSLWLYRAAKT